jgi:glycosyltransferase involved in cell wall biosynthesis
MYGSFVYAAFALLGFGLLRLSGKKVVLILHQVPAVDAEIGTKGIVRAFQRLLIRAFYVLVYFASTRIAVFEKYLSELLGDNSQVIVIPHVLPKIEGVGRDEARRELGWEKNVKVALFFGYISPYKGIERLLSAYEKDSNYNIVIAGGINPNHLGKVEVERYFDSIRSIAKEKAVEITGVVPEEKIETYIAAADVIILPYKIMFSSSGPLAWGIAYAKPILMSREMLPYTHSTDFADAMNGANLPVDDVFIDFDKASVGRFWENYNELSNKWEIMSKIVRKERNLETVARRLDSLFLEINNV